MRHRLKASAASAIGDPQAQRNHAESHPSSFRSPTERDRDRILYCPEFRRLAEVSQIVTAEHGHVFHNRLTHVLKVAQIARAIANWLQKTCDPELVKSLGGLDPFAAEAAALAHDLRHPPFGQTGEAELNRLMEKAGVRDGFEGNAQSFRVVTKLSTHSLEYLGLNLSARTLNGILKYPWIRAKSGHKSRKWGAYRSEAKEFRVARAGFSDDGKSLEAEIMDWADDVAYSVFDLEDFFRGGMLPLDRLFAGKEGGLSPAAEDFLATYGLGNI